MTCSHFAVASRLWSAAVWRAGLSPDEAANLTAFLSGIPVLEQHWRRAEVTGLLFLRELNRGGHFRSDEAPA